MRIKSSSAIQLIHCLPLPTVPPTPNLNGVSIFSSAPPSFAKTTPMRGITTRAPKSFGFFAFSFPIGADFGEKAFARRAFLGQSLVSSIAVKSDCRRGTKIFGGFFAFFESIDQGSCSGHAAFLNSSFLLFRPTSVGDIVARQMHDGIEIFEFCLFFGRNLFARPIESRPPFSPRCAIIYKLRVPLPSKSEPIRRRQDRSRLLLKFSYVFVTNILHNRIRLWIIKL